MKILILDNKNNSVSTYRMLANLFQENDCHVDLLFSPAEAMKVVQDRTSGYDLVLVDYNIPSMNCTEVLQKIRKLNKQLVLVTMAEEIVPKEEIKNIRRYSDYFIAKPIDIDLLKKFVPARV